MTLYRVCTIYINVPVHEYIYIYTYVLLHSPKLAKLELMKRQFKGPALEMCGGSGGYVSPKP